MKCKTNSDKHIEYILSRADKIFIRQYEKYDDLPTLVKKMQ